MPLDDPLRPPHVRSTNSHVGRRHLTTLAVRADCADLQPQVRGDIGGRPPLGLGIGGGGRHGPSMANRLSRTFLTVRLRRV